MLIPRSRVPNAPEVQPQREVINGEFWDAIRMLSQVVAYKVEENKSRNREKFCIKKAKILSNKSGQQKTKNVNRSSFLQRPTEPTSSSASAFAPKKRGEFRNQNSQNFRARPPNLKCVQIGHFMRECPKNRQGNGNGGNRAQSSSATPTNKGATSRIGGRANRLYIITSRQEQKNSPDVVTIGESILVERVNRDCTISVNHKDTMDDLVELDMVDFDVILGMDWLRPWYASGDCRTRVVKFQFPNKPVIE
ncbi:hypothetical protein H5410_062055 [Solanum commersonii]|uniref:Gag-pol polyprotein n=1 Tax=Solanum commersonii TaxID=4109 RepID=A0A9J5W9N4_SOLCO|nr:hypothetical protein H5410_062055 [Solanum commersonii]